MEITLYSTDCPRCRVLETKLKQKGISFNLVKDINEMSTLGLQSAPALKVDHNLMGFSEAVNWVNQQEARH